MKWLLIIVLYIAKEYLRGITEAAYLPLAHEDLRTMIDSYQAIA